MRQAQAGELSAFVALVASDLPALRDFCRTLTDEHEADDLTQETLLRAWTSILRLGEPYRFRPWLFGIAANVARKWWRRRERPLSLDLLLSDDHGEYYGNAMDGALYTLHTPEQAAEDSEASGQLQHALRTLPPSLRRVLVLHYLDGLNYAEIAAALAIPLSTVKGRLFKSRQRLRRQFISLLGANEPPARQQGSISPHNTRRSKRMDLSRKAEVAGQGGTMVRLVVSREVLIDELFAYVVDPSPARARRLDSIVVPELSPLGGRPEPVRWASGSLRTSLRIVLEAMVMDGVRSRRDVAAFVDYLRILSTPHVVEVVE